MTTQSVEFCLRRIVEIASQVQVTLDTNGDTEAALHLVRNQQAMNCQLESLLSQKEKQKQSGIIQGILLR